MTRHDNEPTEKQAREYVDFAAASKKLRDISEDEETRRGFAAYLQGAPEIL